MLALDLRAFILTIIYYISLALKVQLFCSIHLYSSSATKYQMSGRDVEVQYIGNSKGRKENPTVVR